MGTLTVSHRSIAELRRSGLRVFVLHKRYYNVRVDYPYLHKCVVGPLSRKEAVLLGYDPLDVVSKGGYTEVEIYEGDKLIAQGRSHCSERDQFARKIGRQIALGRALVHHEV